MDSKAHGIKKQAGIATLASKKSKHQTKIGQKR
jgi:hypothetical protein